MRKGRMILRVCAGAVLLAAAAWFPPLRAWQAPQPTFRSGVNLVTIDVMVLDEAGRPVPGLTAGEFEIKINGRPQPIRALAFVQAAAPPPASAQPSTPAPPVSPPAGSSRASDALPAPDAPRRTVSNDGYPPAKAEARPAPAAEPSAGEPRLFVIVVDDLSFSPLRGKALLDAAQRFVDRVPASDLIGFTTTSGIGALNPTLDRAALRGALSMVMGQFDDPRGIGKSGPDGGRAAGHDSPLGISESIDIARGDNSMLQDAIVRECFNGDRAAINRMSLPQLLAENHCASEVQRQARQVAGLIGQNRGRQLEGVRSVIAAMKGAGGIRHVVLLSDGIPVSREVGDLHPLVRAAAEAGVQLSVLMEEHDISATDEGRRTPAAIGVTPQVDPGQSRRRREDDLLLVSGLQTMTDMLGGSFHRVIGNGDPFFDRVLAASSAVYRLGVELPPGARAGDAFNVSASVKRPGLSARANRFTVAGAPVATTPEPPPAAPAAPAPAPVVALDDVLKAALNTNAPVGDLPVRMAAFIRRSSSSPGQVDVTVQVALPADAHGPITSYIGVVDGAGAVRSSKRVIETPGPAGYTTSFVLPLAPGEYRLRYAAADTARALGTIELPMRAALTSMGAFTASDLLTWYVDGAGKAQLFALEEIPASPLRASIELYPVSADASAPMVQWTLARESGGAPLKSMEAPAHAGPGLFRADAEFDAAALEPGRYIVRATVMVDGQAAGSKAAAVRK